MNKILFNDLRPQPWLRQLLDKAYQRVMDSGRYIGGTEVEAFEEEWAAYCGAKYCVACGNGFDAIQLVIRALDDIAMYSDVIPVSPFTCLPTWQAVVAAGHSVRPLGWNGTINIDVHLYGMVHQVPEIKKWDYMIEDCAQAHGSRFMSQPAGKQGNVACWSFYPTKNLGCYGDGGAITTDDSVIANRTRIMRNYGEGIYAGINSRLDPIQAAFLRTKLPYLDEWNEQRGYNAVQYTIYLADCPGITLPTVPEGCVPNWHQYAIRAERRDELKAFLAESGVETMIHYPDHPYHQIYGERLAEADEWCKTTLSLPVATHIMGWEVRYISGKIWEFYNQ